MHFCEGGLKADGRGNCSNFHLSFTHLHFLSCSGNSCFGNRSLVWLTSTQELLGRVTKH